MNYVQLSDQQRQEMLDAIGVETVDALFANIPDDVRLEGDLDLPPARGELELQRDLARFAAQNLSTDEAACFMGLGAYDHFIPSAISNLQSNGAFFTAYTPYQAEASQGSLQAFFEFQTQVARLSGLEISNASLYEGASAVSEAVYMALNTTGKRRILVASTVHPDFRRSLVTGCSDFPVELVELPATDGTISPETLKEAMDFDVACVVVQSPNIYGLIEDQDTLFDIAHSEKKTLAISVFNPIAASLLKNPGDCGADIAVGEGQPLGIPMGYGGPWLGLFATTTKLMRKMPGRLIGQTTDADGRRAFCLTLQTREQHIRGAKATSNICTNQGLLALRATIYMSLMGPQGLRETAEQCYHKAHYAADQISALEGYELAYPGPFFHEFVVNCPVPAQTIIDNGREQALLPGVNLGFMSLGDNNQLLITVTEKRTRQEIDQLVTLLKEVA